MGSLKEYLSTLNIFLGRYITFPFFMVLSTSLILLIKFVINKVYIFKYLKFQLKSRTKLVSILNIYGPEMTVRKKKPLKFFIHYLTEIKLVNQ